MGLCQPVDSLSMVLSFIRTVLDWATKLTVMEHAGPGRIVVCEKELLALHAFGANSDQLFPLFFFL